MNHADSRLRRAACKSSFDRSIIDEAICWKKSPHDVVNYRLTRARQVVEIAFGILANRFRVLINHVYCVPSNARLIVEAVVILHNYLLNQKPIPECNVIEAFHNGI